MIASNRRGILLMTVLQFSALIPVLETSVMTSCKHLELVGCVSVTLSFDITHAFSIDSNRGYTRAKPEHTLFVFKKSVATFDLWHGAQLCVTISAWSTVSRV